MNAMQRFQYGKKLTNHTLPILITKQKGNLNGYLIFKIKIYMTSSLMLAEKK